MMATTRIEWSDAVWNPTTGCDRVSPGCDNCYALTMSARLKAMGQAKYQTDGRPETSGPGFGVQIHPDTLDEPLRWRKPRRVFVDSMSDLFHPQVGEDFVARVFAVMSATPQHTYQILTKRPQRMRALLGSSAFWLKVQASWYRLGLHDRRDRRNTVPEAVPEAVGVDLPLPNVWLGTSVEDQQRADERIPLLLDTPAVVRFVSCEPLLGPVDLRCVAAAEVAGGRLGVDYLAPDGMHLDWVIVGGESGPGARPMRLGWARTLVEQCRAAGVACFVKQLGSRAQVTGKGGDPDEWPLALRVREFPDRATL